MSSAVFRGIASFVAVADESSFRRGAARIGVTKAAVSKAVHELEESLGVILLQRSSRAVSLTVEGARFYERCKRAVAEVRGAREEIATERTPSGEVKLSLSFIVAEVVFPTLAILQTRYPRLRFRAQVSDQMARFADEGVDVAVRVGARREASLTAKTLRKTRWVTVASPVYLARNEPLASPDDLARHRRLAFVAPDGRPRAWTYRERRPLEVSDAALALDYGPGLVSAALVGMGVCQVLDFMVDEPLRDGSLVEVLAEDALEGPPIVAVHTIGRRPSPNVQVVVQQLVDAFRVTRFRNEP